MDITSNKNHSSIDFYGLFKGVPQGSSAVWLPKSAPRLPISNPPPPGEAHPRFRNATINGFFWIKVHTRWARPLTRYKWSYSYSPEINGRKNMGNWDYFTLLLELFQPSYNWQGPTFFPVSANCSS